MLVRAPSEGRSDPSEIRALHPYLRVIELRDRLYVPGDILRDRDRRQNLARCMSLTARLMGDPPPGRSALDNR